MANQICCRRKCCTYRAKSASSTNIRSPVQAFRDAREQALTLTLRGQCNDPYWHGVFGGLYSPHLRTELWRSLIQAESIADSLANPTGHYQNVATLDFDSDGHDEIYFTSDRYAAVLCPADGATISALDCRQSNAALVNSLARRPESYHSKIKNLKAGSGARRPIHSRANARERNGTGPLAELRSLGAPLFPLVAFRPREERTRIAARCNWRKMPRSPPETIAR